MTTSRPAYAGYRYPAKLIAHTALLHGIVFSDNQGENRIASSSNAPEWIGHCLIKMLT